MSRTGNDVMAMSQQVNKMSPQILRIHPFQRGYAESEGI
jgi:hypothetical protein